MTSSQPVKVFISYSHDSPEHADSVLELSDRLRNDGIDCVLDQYEISPSEGWPRWMEKQIREADFILMICTKTYYQRVMGQEIPGTGRGVRWEGNIIYQHIYDADTKNTKFIPVLMENGKEDHIPVPVKGWTFYRLYNGYENLYRHLTNQPLTLKPDRGPTRQLPPLERKTDFFLPWNVPYHRNNYFTGREELLKQLHNRLKVGRAAALAQAISGLGGIGKTQTAVEYAYRYSDEYEAVLWSRADSSDAIVSDFAAIAELLDLPEKESREQELAVKAVMRWLEGSRNWLLILDNADDPELIEDFIPHDPRGSILLTSRAQFFDCLGITDPVELDKMRPYEAKDFLIKRTGRSNVSEAEIKAIEELAEELDYLPLALEQAGAYIFRMKKIFQDYLDGYRRRGLQLLEKRKPVTGKYPKSVLTTWSLNFEQVEQSSMAAADLLRVSAFVDQDRIPLELFTSGAEELGPELSQALVSADPLILDQVLEPVTQFSLIRVDFESQTYDIHRLVQAVIIEEMDDTKQRQWAERAVRTVTRVFPDVEFSNWHLCERLLRHGQACAGLIEKWGFEFEEAGLLLNQTGFYLYERARYAQAEPLYKRSLAIREKALGPEHPYVASSLNNLAALYYAQGLYAQAEPLLKRSLAIAEKALGPEHPDVATVLKNYTELLRKTGREADAGLNLRAALKKFVISIFRKT